MKWSSTSSPGATFQVWCHSEQQIVDSTDLRTTSWKTVLLKTVLFKAKYIPRVIFSTKTSAALPEEIFSAVGPTRIEKPWSKMQGIKMMLRLASSKIQTVPDRYFDLRELFKFELRKSQGTIKKHLGE
jgi:hypothetical protein